MAEEVKNLIIKRDAFIAEYALVLRSAAASIVESFNNMCILVAPHLTKEGCKTVLGKHPEGKKSEDLKYMALVMIISGVLKVADATEVKSRQDRISRAISMFSTLPEKKKTKLAKLVDKYITASNMAIAHLHLFGLHNDQVFIRPKGIGNFDDRWFIAYDTFGPDSKIIESPYFYKMILCASFQKVYDDNDVLPPDLHIKCPGLSYESLKFGDFDLD